uniref:Uncharacterized protein n=1 Tax=Anguilla anguilla TaxID=7936 RepID=A0A0E9TJB5_ANGAN
MDDLKFIELSSGQNRYLYTKWLTGKLGIFIPFSACKTNNSQ